MQLMSDEAHALTREIREQNASNLQAILDNVKDAIITVDYVGHIESFNHTGERIFGYSTAEILGRSLGFLLADIEARDPSEYLERLAIKIDDTHVDLAAHQMWGLAKGGNRVSRGDRRQQGQAQLARRLHRLRPRHHRKASCRTIGARKRGALPDAGGACSRSDRGIRCRCRQVRRCQRQCLPLFQDEPRNAAQLRSRGDQSGAAARRHAFLRHRARLRRERLGRRGAGVRLGALRFDRPELPLRSALRAAAEFQSPPASRQHHRHHRAQTRRRDCHRRAAGVRENRRQFAAVLGARVDLRGDRARHAGELLRDQSTGPRKAGVELRRGAESAAPVRGGHGLCAHRHPLRLLRGGGLS